MNKDVQNYVLTLLAKENVELQSDKTISCDQQLKDVVDDSLSLLEIIYDLEDKFHITLESQRLMGLESVADLIEAVDQESAASA